MVHPGIKLKYDQLESKSERCDYEHGLGSFSPALDAPFKDAEKPQMMKF